VLYQFIGLMCASPILRDLMMSSSRQIWRISAGLERKSEVVRDIGGNRDIGYAMAAQDAKVRK